MTDRKGISKIQRARVILAWHGRCAKCCKPLDIRTDIDHIVPVWLGGTNEDDNLRPLHVRCHADRTKIDARDRAHVKRLNGTTAKRPGRKIPASANGLRSAGFPQNLRKKLNGAVVPRPYPST
jgi:5-methylcytosine-specific restriction enzyme A